MSAATPKPFQIAVEDSVLEDLHSRLARARLPGAPADAEWQYGIKPAYLEKLLAYWRDEFDWRKAEAKLNDLPQFTAPLAGPDGEMIDLHFVHARAENPDAPALLILHGWPGSFFEFQEIIDPLTHPERHTGLLGGQAAQAMHVVAPSLPGYGYSGAPARPMMPRQIAEIMMRLMREVLGYDKYLVQGGDWGALINSWSVVDFPDHVLAGHFNMPGMRPRTGPDDPALSDEETVWLKDAQKRRADTTGYQAIQGTKSQTLAYALTDSPVGLAAWIAEKFHGWSNPALAEPPFTMDQLLTNIMIYWTSGCMNSSTWLYRSLLDRQALLMPEGRAFEPPVGFCLPKYDLMPPPPASWLKRLGNVTSYNRLDDGGHFTALQMGPELVADMRAFYTANGVL